MVDPSRPGHSKPLIAFAALVLLAVLVMANPFPGDAADHLTALDVVPESEAPVLVVSRDSSTPMQATIDEVVTDAVPGHREALEGRDASGAAAGQLAGTSDRAARPSRAVAPGRRDGPRPVRHAADRGRTPAPAAVEARRTQGHAGHGKALGLRKARGVTSPVARPRLRLAAGPR